MSITNCTERDEKASSQAASYTHCGAPASSRTARAAETISNPISISPVSASNASLLPAIQQSVDIDRDACARISSQKVIWKLASAACFAIGAAIIVYPTDKTLSGILNAIFIPPPGHGCQPVEITGTGSDNLRKRLSIQRGEVPVPLISTGCYGWVSLVMRQWPSCLLFLFGKIAWEEGK